jgi:PAS domain S-box-containing protein
MSANRHNPRAFSVGLLLTACILSAVFWHGIAPALDRKKAITQYGHNVWQTENGLPQNSVQAIIQTHDGYLWLGTEEGVVRFDGIHFTVFDRKNTHEIKDNNIQALFEAPDGSLWIATLGGGLSRLKDGSFVSYTTSEGLPSNVVRSVFEDRSGSLWIGTYGAGLAQLKDGKVTTYTSKDGLSNNFVRSIIQDREGDLWIGTTGGLSRMRDGKFTSYTRKHGLPGDIVRTIYQDRKGVVWIGTSGGLGRLKDGKITSYTVKDGLPHDAVRSLYEDRDGSLWIGTLGGLSRFADGTFTNYTTTEGLPDNEVVSIFEDREGSLWIGMGAGGLEQLKDGMFTTYTSQEGLSNNEVWSVTEGRDGSLWIGTNGGGFDRLRGRSISTISTKQGLSNSIVRSVYEARDGSLWIGTNRGLNRLRDGRIITNTAKQGLANEAVRAIYEDRERNVWIGTDGAGLYRFRRGHFTTYTTSEGLANNVVWAITGGQDGSLWIGTNAGLSRYKDRKFTSYTTRDGLSSDFVISLYESKEGALWIGTMNGLNRLFDGKFTSYTTQDGLFDDAPSQILEDDNGNFWMSCNKGIWRVSKKELDDFAEGKIKSVTSFSYGRADGMKSSECNGGCQPAGWKASDGRLWFPTIKGVVVVDPNRLEINRLPPPVTIEQVVVDGQAVGQIENTSFSQGKKKFEFHYAGLSFLAPEKVKFRYRLDGFDGEWVDAGTERVAHYTNIPPGDYTFMVTASNNDGIWNEKRATFNFYLQPYFYQTHWFYAFCFLTFILAGRGLYYARVKHLKRRQNELALTIHKQTRELQKEVAERKRAGKRHATIIQSALDGFWISDSKGRILDVNNSLCQMLGYAREEMLAMCISDVEATEKPEETAQHVQRIFEQGYDRFTTRHRCKDGKILDVEISANHVDVEEGRLVVFIRDITERKRAEEALRESERKYRDLINGMNDAVWVIDFDTTILDVNNTAAKILGYTRQELLSMKIPDIDDSLAPEEIQNLARNMPRDKIRVFETYHTTKDGRKLPVEVSSSLVSYGGKTVILSIARDITERKRTEEQLLDSQQNLQTLMDASPIGISWADTHGDIQYTNRKFRELFGYTVEDIPDIATWRARAYPVPAYREPIPSLVDLLSEAQKQGKEAAPVEMTVTCKDGSTRHVLQAGALASHRILAIYTDITDRKRAEEALQRERNLLRTLIDNLPDLIYVKDSEFRKTIANLADVRNMGCRSEAEVLGKTDFDFYPAEIAAKFFADDQSVIQTAKPVINREEFVFNEQAEKRWLLTSKFPLRDEKGQTIGLVGIGRDISVRKRAEEALQQERNLLRTVIDNLPDVIYVKDAECRKTVVNKADLRNMGCQSEAEALGKTDFDLYPREVAEAFYADDLSVLETGKSIINREEFFFDPEGKKRWLLTTKLPLRDQNGHIVGLVGIGHDITERKRVEAALKESEERYRNLFENAPIGIYRTTPDGQVLMANPRFIHMLGYSSFDQLRTHNLEDDGFKPNPSRGRFKELVERDDIVTGFEVTWAKRDGSRIYVRENARAIRDTNGKVLFYEGTIEDITEQKRTEEQATLLAQAVESTTELISITNLQGNFTFVNRAFLEAYGYSEEEILGKHYRVVRSPRNARILEDEISEDTNHGGWRGELTNRRKDGSEFPISLSTSVVRDKEGKAFGLLGVAADISERKQTEEALTKLSSAVEQAVDGVIITTKAGIIEYVNPAWEKMTAFSREDAIGKTPRILKSGKQGDSVYRAMWKTISNGEVWKGSLINKRKSGELFHAEVSIAPIFEENHTITHFVAIERDVTEHRQLEQQLIQALKMEGIGTLAGGVAHDFNNLLGIILGHASLLEGRKQDSTKFSRSVEAISTAVQRGAGLVRQLLTFARKTETVFELVSANETVGELVQMLRETFPRTIEFSLNLSKDLPPIYADRNQLYQALLNLCVNSRDAMPTVGTISIRTHTIPRSKLQAKYANAIEEKYILITVSDTGIGMDEATRSRIFEPFFTTKERGKGTGLGLSVVYGVVDSHNGFIDVESEVGHGTTFNLYFPVSPLRVEPSLAQQQEPKETVGAGETILVVEDEELLLDSVTQVLEGKGYRVLAARDGTEGLELYRRHRDDVAVVLMDMGLPKLGGWEVFQKMKAVNPRVKVVLASGYLDPYIKSEMLKAGAKDFIQKPYVPEQILSRVRRVIDGK